jgi:hypothetical protein
LSIRHGSYANVALEGRAAELAASLRDALPVFDPVLDEPGLRSLALVRARLERAHERLALSEQQGDDETTERLARDCRGWHRLEVSLADRFGLSPLARARLAGAIAEAREGSLADYVEATYSEDRGEG